MIALAEQRIELHVLQEVVHPTHVPLHGESESVILDLGCNLRPCGGFLSDHDCTLISSEQTGIHMLKELDGFEVLVLAVFVGYPLAVLLSIVKIQHGCDRIYTETVDMEELDPVKGVGHKEVLDFRTAVIVDLGTPVRMLALTRVLVLIELGAVEAGKTCGVFREVCRYPVKDNADALLVEVVDHVLEVIRRAVAGCRCIIAGHLISPGSVKRMLCDTHQLDVGVAHILAVIGSFLRELAIVVEAFLASAGRFRMLHP